MLLIPVDTSECERLFSMMNDIKNAQRGNLGAEVMRDEGFDHLVLLWQGRHNGAAAGV